MNSRVIGKEWEAEALKRLEGAGLRLLDRNYQCRMGELDLVLRDGEGVVFAEVRFRRSHEFGSGAETVGVRKRRRVIAAAQHYLQRHPELADRPCRFDVVSIGPGATPQVEWIRNAFSMDSV